MVGALPHLALLHVKMVIVLRAPAGCRLEAVPDLHALDRPDGHHRLGQVGVQLLKHRLPDAHGHAPDPALHNAAGGVRLRHPLLQEFFRPPGRQGVRHVQPVFLHLLPGETALVDGHIPDGGGVGPHPDAQALKEAGRDGSRRHPPGGLPPGGPSSSPVVPEAVFQIEGVVRVSRTVHLHEIPVVPGSLIGIPNHHGNGRARGPALKHAGEDLHLIPLRPGGGESALPRFSPV